MLEYSYKSMFKKSPFCVTWWVHIILKGDNTIFSVAVVALWHESFRCYDFDLARAFLPNHAITLYIICTSMVYLTLNMEFVTSSRHSLPFVDFLSLYRDRRKKKNCNRKSRKHKVFILASSTACCRCQHPECKNWRSVEVTSQTRSICGALYKAVVRAHRATPTWSGGTRCNRFIHECWREFLAVANAFAKLATDTHQY